VLAGADAGAAVAVPFALAGIEDDRGRDGAARGADARDDLVGVLRLDQDAALADQLDPG
jgi:hypothetical protein